MNTVESSAAIRIAGTATDELAPLHLMAAVEPLSCIATIACTEGLAERLVAAAAQVRANRAANQAAAACRGFHSTAAAVPSVQNDLAGLSVTDLLNITTTLS